jgi:hypothetical protein
VNKARRGRFDRTYCADPLKAWAGEYYMEEQRHGRYYAQELMLDSAVNTREQIQDALDEGERLEWHLVGVSDVLPERGVILFWDTARPSYGRRAT